MDLTEFYFAQRKVWAVMYALAAAFDLMRSLEHVVLGHAALTREQAVPAALTVVMLAGPAIMYFASSRRMQWIGVLWLVPFVVLATIDGSIEV